jgi:hypothetical protein
MTYKSTQTISKFFSGGTRRIVRTAFGVFASILFTVILARTVAAAFGPVTQWTNEFSDPLWNSNPAYFSTIKFPDIDGDGQADVCGRGTAGLLCGLSWANTARHSFSPPQPVQPAATAFSDANGWNSDPAYYSTIQFADLDGDTHHKADVCGRGSGGIWCALSNSSQYTNGISSLAWPGFQAATLWTTQFSDPWWKYPAYYSTIQLADINGDGKADVCGRGGDGIWCALSTGTSFGPSTLWTSNFSDAYGWNSDPSYYRTIRFVDINGDGLADVCGRGHDGILCAFSLGTSFGPVQLVSAMFSDANGWKNNAAYYSTIQFADLNNDHKADVCGRGSDGIWCALSISRDVASLPAFSGTSRWTFEFSDANGWKNDAAYYSTIRLADFNGDGFTDVCGRHAALGIICAPSTGSSFGAATALVTPGNDEFSDGNGWNDPTNYSTIQFPDLNNDRHADLCGRADNGIRCGIQTQ